MTLRKIGKKITLVGKKQGMVQIFDETGNTIPCTVISIEPHYVTQVKTEEKDGYNAIQIGSIAKEKNKVKPQAGHCTKTSSPYCSKFIETKVNDVREYSPGQKIGLEQLSELKFVDVTGISKGKGYQGVMKLHGFRGGPGAHGSKFHRHAGSTGMRTTPGRCLPGGKRASRMGGDRKTVQNLAVVKVDVEKGILIVKGAVSGFNGSVVYINQAEKKVA